jgi:ADP-ribose pyrophosphatase YjhB (NUDIX family)
MCATPLVDCWQGGKLRPSCPACGFVYYADPKLAVAVLIERDGAVLMGRRVNEPGRGRWSLPAGYVDRGEAVEEAAIREAREELSVEVQVGPLIGLYSAAGEVVVLAVYAATILRGDPIATDDLDAIGYFAPGDEPTLAFPRDLQILAEWQRRR